MLGHVQAPLFFGHSRIVVWRPRSQRCGGSHCFFGTGAIAGNHGFGEGERIVSVSQDIRQFVVDNFLMGQDSSRLKDDTSFLEEGVIDSTGVLELVAFLEETYEIKVEDEELVPENLDAIGNISAFLQRKRS